MAIDFSFLDAAAPQPQQDVANVTLRVDADAMLLCDGEDLDIKLKAGVVKKAQLPAGQHLLEFWSEKNPDVKIEKVVDFPVAGKNYLVMVSGLQEALAQFESKAAAALGAKRVFKLVITGYENEMSAMMVVCNILGWSPAESREKLSHLPAVLIESEDYARIEALANQFSHKNVNVSIETRNGLGELINSTRLQTRKEVEEVETKRKAEVEAKRREAAETCVIPEGVEVLNDRKDFNRYYKGQSKVIFPSTLKRLGKMEPAIDDEMMIDVGCKLLCAEERIKEVDLSKCTKLEIIGVGAFANSYNLSKVNLPDSLKEIKPFAFKSCQRLEEIVIPENTHIIGESAFAWCKGLKKVNFKNPYGVKIHPNAFDSCKNLEYFNADT